MVFFDGNETWWMYEYASHNRFYLFIVCVCKMDGDAQKILVSLQHGYVLELLSAPIYLSYA